MASNQNVNKVVYGGTTLIDLTGDDVTAASVLSGKKFHLPSGAQGTGTIATKTASNLSASGKTVTVPAGYYASQATKDVATGSATAPASISGSSATVSTGTNTLTLTKTVSVTPSVTAGYVASGTAGNSSVSLSASVATKAAATITPGTTNQTIAAGTYLTGAQTIQGSSNLTAANIRSGVTIFGVTGTLSGGWTGSLPVPQSFGSTTQKLFFGTTKAAEYPVMLLPGTYTVSCNNSTAYSLYYRSPSGASRLKTPATNQSASFSVSSAGLYAFWLYDNNSAIVQSSVSSWSLTKTA